MFSEFDCTPNILLLTIDSLRFDHFGNQHRYDLTPQIDQLLDSAVQFNNAFINGVGTPKSFPAILTGSYPLSYGGPEYMSDSRASLAEYLSEQGYKTIGHSTNHYISYHSNYHRGFDRFEEHYDLTRKHRSRLIEKAQVLHQRGYSPEQIAIQLEEEIKCHYVTMIESCEEYLDGIDWQSGSVVEEYEQLTEEYDLFQRDPEQYLNEYCGIPETRFRQALNRFINRAKSVARRSEILVEAYDSLAGREKPYMSATRLTNELLDDLDQFDGDDEPFFLWGHYMDAHTPFIPGDNESWTEEYRKYLNDEDQPDIPLRKVNSQSPDVVEALYRACIRYIDDQIGRVIDKVNTLDRDTLVVVTSDHGEEFGEHGDVGHKSKLYDELIHVPLIVGSTKGTIDPQTVSQLISHVDLIPSLVEPVTGAGYVPDSIEGQNVFDQPREHVIAETLRTTGSSDVQHDEALDIENDVKIIGARTQNEKAIYYDGSEKWEFYNLDADPWEQHDLSTERDVDRYRDLIERRLDYIEQGLNEVRHVDRTDIVSERLEDLGYL